MLKILSWKTPTRLLVLAVPICALNAAATELYNNLSGPATGLQLVAGPSPIIPLMVGDSFSTDGNAYQLTAVTLSFQGTFNGTNGFVPDPIGSNNLYLYNSTNGAPPVPDTSKPPVLLGSLADVNVPGSPGTAAPYTFVPLLPVGLAPNTRYWIALGGTCVAPPGSMCADANWSFGDGTGVGVAGEYHGDNFNPSTKSTTVDWTPDTSLNDVRGSLPYLMEVQAQQTPEPSTFAFGASGLAGLLAVFRRPARR